MKKLLIILFYFPMISFGQETEECVSGDCTNGQGTYTWANGDKYVGEWRYDKPHGQGTFIWADGDIYMGEYKDGKMSGQGTYTWTNGTKYVGEYKDDKMSGQGTFIYLNGDKYVGEFRNDKKNGYGIDININTGIMKLLKIEQINGLEIFKELATLDPLSIKENIIKYVELKISDWQKKDEFEKMSAYKERVNEYTQNLMIEKYQKEAIQMLANCREIDFSSLILKPYDSENECFLLYSDQIPEFIVHVPIAQARNFKQNFSSLQYSNAEFQLKDSTFILSHLDIKDGDNHYTYNNQDKSIYTTTNIDYNFKEIEININEPVSNSNKIKKNINIKVGVSDVDVKIPNKKTVKNRYALIIGNEDYQSKQMDLSTEQNVDYAVHDAKIFKEYALKTLGVSEDNMFFLTDATTVEMNREIKRVAKIIQKIGTEAELIVYYAGHGLPDENTKVPYLIPVDVSSSDLDFAIKLDDFYKDLASTGAKRITVFLDACFTGGGRNSGLVAARGFKVKPKKGDLDGNIVVFSASSQEQSAHPFHKEGHGMFTYHLLKKLKESKGKVSMGELADYVAKNVSIQSLKINTKEQDPVVNTSKKVEETWKKWKF